MIRRTLLIACLCLPWAAQGQETATPVQAIVVQSSALPGGEILIVWNGVPYRAKLAPFGPTPTPDVPDPVVPPTPIPDTLTPFGRKAFQAVQATPQTFNRVQAVARVFRSVAQQGSVGGYEDYADLVADLATRIKAEVGDQWPLWQPAAQAIGQALNADPGTLVIGGATKALLEIAAGLEATGRP
jgi:hypothetical protein